MKKIFLVASLTVACSAFAQINVPATADPTITGENAFLDAASYSQQLGNYDHSTGKGLSFPQTDLTQFNFKTDQVGPSFFGTWFDGMVVYNTATGNTASGQGQTVAVTPGFYYFSNPTGVSDGAITNGKWIRLGADAGAAVAQYWALKGNAGTTEATLADAANNNFTITGGNWLGTTDAKSLTVGTNNIARLNIGAKKENVGGTDFDFVLKVYGKAKFDQGIVTSASTYPDYVFDKYFTGKSEENAKYNFLTLAQTEKFIKENNHLPGVTSIKELTKANGAYEVDNTKLSIQTLEKVEELYLHTIEQQKQIEALKAEVAALKAKK